MLGIDPATSKISIHAPRVGCDAVAVVAEFCLRVFQSTHPGWGATGGCRACKDAIRHFNPRTPGGVRPPKLIG